MSNTEIWDKLSKPPKEALKTIGGGRLKGMTDINPQWRYEAMTQMFGIVGIGWKFTVDKLWREDASEGQVFSFACVSVYINHDGKWSEPIIGYGGSMLVALERNGLYSSDEGYKMAITDALGTAMKMLGVASEIYSGRWDGSKYTERPKGKDEGAHKPSGGSIERLEGTQLAKVSVLAEEILEAVKDELYGIQNAHNLISNAGLDNDEKVALWEMLAPYSKIRNQIKAYAKSIQENK